MKQEYIMLRDILVSSAQLKAASLDAARVAIPSPQLPVSQDEYIERLIAEATAPRAARM